MPCYMTGSREGDLALDVEQYRKTAEAATRAACDLAKAVEKVFGKIGIREVILKTSIPTQKWVHEHELIDKKRRK